MVKNLFLSLPVRRYPHQSANKIWNQPSTTFPCHIIYFLLFLTTLPHFVTSSIYQSSEAGEVAKVKFDMSQSGGNSQCCDLKARGNLTLLDTSVYLDTSFFDFFSTASDMFIVVKRMNSNGNGEVIECK